MPRKVVTGAAIPVALGYQDADGDWQPLPNVDGSQSMLVAYLNAAGDAVYWRAGPEGAPEVELNPIVTTTENGTAAVNGNNTLILAPGAGRRLVVTAFCIQNASAVATTAILRSASTANGWRVLGQNQGDGLAMSFGNGREWRLNANEALVLNLSAAQTHNYSVSYFQEYV